MRKNLVALLSVALLTACAGVPTSSAVHFGQQLEAESGDQFIRVIARPPVEDMSAEEVLKGFLAACADSANNYEIARQYLLPKTATGWNPAIGISVYRDTDIKIATEGELMTFSAIADSVVTATGHYSVAEPGTSAAGRFRLERDGNNQWRIAWLADGLFLTRDAFERSFRSYPVFFLDPKAQTLIPDAIMVPSGYEGAATALVRALLDGPSREIASSVINAIPAGTTLTYDSVPVNDGRATVDLSGEILSADNETRSALAAQIVWTLSSLPEVAQVTLKVTGQSFAIPEVGETQSITDFASYAPNGIEELPPLHVLNGPTINVVDENGALIPRATITAPSSETLRRAALSRTTQELAAVSTTRRQLYVARTEALELTPVATGEAFGTPSWDTQGNLFVADFGVGVFEYTSDNRWQPVVIEPTTFGGALEVREIRFAPDGVRVAVVMTTGTADVVAIGYATRSKTQTRITGLHRIESSISSVLDLGWHSISALAVLGSDGNGGEQIFNVSTYDSRITSESAPVGSQVLAVDGLRDLILAVSRSDSFELLTPELGGWSPLGITGIPFYRG